MSDDLQRTAEWFSARSGRFTGSVISDITARHKTTGAKLASFDNRVWEVVQERLSHTPKEGPQGVALQWGAEAEPFAIEQYELATGNIVTAAGFTQHPVYSFAGASPDGLVGDDGILEIKCPKDPTVHLRRFVEGVPKEYIPQIQMEMWVTGRAWADFASYDPRTEEKFRLLIIRVPRDEEFIKLLETSVLEAEVAAQELQAKLERIAARLIERMEVDGVVTPMNNKGNRDVFLHA